MGNILGTSVCEDGGVETFSLIWLDGNVDSEENLRSKDVLRETINEITTFRNEDECIKYIRNRSANDRIVLISSGGLGQTTVPKIHELRQVFSIYIYCRDKNFHKQWSKKYVKVQNVFNVLQELIDRIQFDQKFQNYKVNEQLSISIFNTKYFVDKCDPDSYEHLVYSQLLIDCLLQLPMNPREKSELYALCKTEYKGNKTELPLIAEFERTYSGKQAIWWYTRDSFVYKMLIKALRVQNLDLLFLFRFIIRDIQAQIEQDRLIANIDVYRSQLITKRELQKLKDSHGQYISVNSFLSAISDQKAAIAILNQSPVSYDIERVLFEIHADGRLPGIKPFTNINSKSESEQDETLFSIGSIFQLNDIRRDEGSIWIIEMTLCSNDNNQLQPLFEDIKQQYGDMKSCQDSFGIALQKMLKYEEAEKFYRRLVEIPSLNSTFIGECGRKLLQISIDKENYDRQMQLFGESITIYLKKNKVNGYSHASNHIQKGEEYRKQGNIPRALDSYNKALRTLQQSYGNVHHQVGRCHSNIGAIYQESGNHQDALKHYEEARNILENHLPFDHPDVSEIYGRIGDMHANLEHYEEALENYGKSLKSAQRVSISQLPAIISIMNKMASIYEKEKDFRTALAYYEDLSKLLPVKHVHIEENNSNIERVRSKLT